MMAALRNWLDGLQTRLLPENGFRMAGIVLIGREELEKIFLRDLKHFPLQVRTGELKKILRRRVQSAAAMPKRPRHTTILAKFPRKRTSTKTTIL